MNEQMRLVRRQLTIFALVALVALMVVSFRYLQLPKQFGWGEMGVTAELPSTGGLGSGARVTYRGVEVGKVKDVRLRPGGVLAELSVEKDAHLPGSVAAQVHSTSVIGEQYLELLPTDGSVTAAAGASNAVLEAGDVVPAARRQPVPVDAGTLLTTVDALLRSVDPSDLRTTVDELNTAFDGSGEPLGKMLDGGAALLGDAQADLAVTKQLIADLGPVLATQKAVSPDVVSIAADLSRFTGQLRMSDGDIRSLIAQGPAAMEQITGTVTDLHPVLPQVLANLAATGEVLRVYLPGLKQTLTIYPAMVTTLQAVALTTPVKGRTKMYFHLNINDPQPCRAGFTGRHRSVKELSPTASLDNGYCRMPNSAGTVVRGARNAPCPTGGRAATAAGCGYDFTKTPKATLTSYDPETGAFTGPDGKPYRINLNSKPSPATSPYTSGLLTALGSR